MYFQVLQKIRFARREYKIIINIVLHENKKIHYIQTLGDSLNQQQLHLKI